MPTYFSSNGVLRAGLWECQVWISHRHIRGRPNLLSCSHSHCITVSKRESWFDVRTEPKKNKENNIRVWAVSDKAVVCEQWVLRPLCVNGDTAGVCEQWLLIAIGYEWWYGRCVWTMSVKASVCVRWHGRCVCLGHCVWTVTSPVCVNSEWHGHCVWTVTGPLSSNSQWYGHSLWAVTGPSFGREAKRM